MICFLKRRIEKLQKENEQLRTENVQLRNRPTEEVQRQVIQITTPKKAKKFDMETPLEEWGSGHYVSYFREKYMKKYRHTYELSTKDWAVFCTRIKTFRSQHEDISNKHFKMFMDWLFTGTYVPTLMSVASLTLYQKWRETKYGRQLRNSSSIISIKPSDKPSETNTSMTVEPSKNVDISDLKKKLTGDEL